jgi:hypothetical protein
MADRHTAHGMERRLSRGEQLWEQSDSIRKPAVLSRFCLIALSAAQLSGRLGVDLGLVRSMGRIEPGIRRETALFDGNQPIRRLLSACTRGACRVIHRAWPVALTRAAVSTEQWTIGP